ncbi:MAG: hypothetical protein ACI4JC_01260 [Faecalibacterium sp.]
MVNKKNRLVAVPASGTEAPVLDTRKVPSYIKQNIGQVVFDAIQRDFQRPEVKADYERWKAERQANGCAAK